MGSKTFKGVVDGLHAPSLAQVSGLPLLDLLLRAARAPLVRPTVLYPVNIPSAQLLFFCTASAYNGFNSEFNN